ncbi:IS66 family insertion sequence element accessory protein TnpB [Burkholderia sp. BCC1993]|uniref:IS66 family insertion sequence element accessory protein TnpB n=1 Tax=Burkholderia sp. BCC1993 TaxID=2817444 RepID=UPI0039EE802C
MIKAFGAAHSHHAYLFTNRSASRMKVRVHDGIGIRLAARRLNQGQFAWPSSSEPQTVRAHARTTGGPGYWPAVATYWRRRRNPCRRGS